VIVSPSRYESAARAGPTLYASSAYRTCPALRSASLYTATMSTPSSSQAAITRIAISPRLATRTFSNIAQYDFGNPISWLMWLYAICWVTGASRVRLISRHHRSTSYSVA